jgi:hypothetical protein
MLIVSESAAGLKGFIRLTGLKELAQTVAVADGSGLSHASGADELLGGGRQHCLGIDSSR